MGDGPKRRLVLGIEAKGSGRGKMVMATALFEIARLSRFKGLCDTVH